MNYVKHFTINGINTTQVGCIELNGKPNGATEGAVGLLGIDVTSPTHDVYKCVAVNGSIYTWELLSSGMSVLSAKTSGEGVETKRFPYSDLRIPNNYIVKICDLILDSEGYLYQIDALESEYCTTTYTGVSLTEEILPSALRNSLLEVFATHGSLGLQYDLYDDYAVCSGVGECNDDYLEIGSIVKNFPVTRISNRAFYECYNFTSVVIPDSVTTIGNYAFWGCANIGILTIGNGVTSIGEGAFAECIALIDVVIPNSVTNIGKMAFHRSDSIENVSVGNSVTAIGEMAFDTCTGLKTIIIPKSVTSIGKNAFYACASLTDVYYTGTAADWAKIDIASGNDALSYATKHYHYGG